MSLEVSDGGIVGMIAAGVLAAATALNQFRKSNSDTSRQIQNNDNANEWQTTLIARNAELEKRAEDHWILLTEARFEIAKSQADSQLWRYKFDELVRTSTERYGVMEAALRTANDEIARNRKP